MKEFSISVSLVMLKSKSSMKSTLREERPPGEGKMKTKKFIKLRKVPGKRKKKTTRLKILVSSQNDLKVTLMLKRCLRRLVRERSPKEEEKNQRKRG